MNAESDRRRRGEMGDERERDRETERERQRERERERSEGEESNISAGRQRREDTETHNKTSCVSLEHMIDKTPAYPRVLGHCCCISPSVHACLYCVCVCVCVMA